MTEKRFWLERFDRYEAIIHDKDKMLKEEEAVDLLNALHEENQELRKALKKMYMVMSGCLCDACKYEEAIYTNNWFIGEDYDVKCNKGHKILADDEKQECNDFELRLEDLE